MIERVLMTEFEPDRLAANDSTPAEVEPGARVTLHFSLALADGSVIDSNYDKKAASFVVGDGSLLPGFEQALAGLQSGAKVRVLLAPEEAFGAVNPGNVQTLPRHKFTAMLNSSVEPVEPGTVLSFADGGGHEIPGVVQHIDETSLVVDFNHPLAGRDIFFAADILSVLPAGVQTLVIQ
jgi:FKBP-type peptidyl-prolyl cis-trans isomerase SlpA